MSFFNEFPFTRTYDGDLGWLIRRVKSFSYEIENFIDANSIHYSDPILWDIKSAYPPYTIVIDEEGNAYLSKQPVPAGVLLTNDEYWQPVYINLMEGIKHYEPWINVKSLGLKGDGSNETSALEQIVSEYKFLWFPSGTYCFREADISGVYIKTADAIFRPEHDQYGNFGTIFTGSDFIIDGASFIDNQIGTADNPEEYHTCIEASGKMVVIKNCSFKNFYARKSKNSSSSYGDERRAIAITGRDIKKISIENCYFENLIGDEIVQITSTTDQYTDIENIRFIGNELNSCVTTTVSGYEFKTYSINLFAENIEISGNHFSKRKSIYSIFNLRATNALIENNMFEECEADIVFDANELCLCGINNGIFRNNVVECAGGEFIEARGGNLIIDSNVLKTRQVIRHLCEKNDGSGTPGVSAWKFFIPNEELPCDFISVTNNLIYYGYGDKKIIGMSCPLFFANASTHTAVFTSYKTDCMLKISGNVFIDRYVNQEIYADTNRRYLIIVTSALKNVLISDNDFGTLPDASASTTAESMVQFIQTDGYTLESLRMINNHAKSIPAGKTLRPLRIDRVGSTTTFMIAELQLEGNMLKDDLLIGYPFYNLSEFICDRLKTDSTGNYSVKPGFVQTAAYYPNRIT